MKASCIGLKERVDHQYPEYASEIAGFRKKKSHEATGEKLILHSPER